MSIVEVIANPRVRQWLPGVLNGGILLLLTASLAQWTWLVIKPPLPPLVLTPPTPSPQQNTFSLQPLLAAHLFGQVSQELTGGRLDNLPISSLNLVLTGVIASASGGYALISVNGQPQEPFGVGQTVTGDAVLQAVYPDRVVIQRNGVLESLMLEGAEKTPMDQWTHPRQHTVLRPRPAILFRKPGRTVIRWSANSSRRRCARRTSYVRQPWYRPKAAGFRYSKYRRGACMKNWGCARVM